MVAHDGEAGTVCETASFRAKDDATLIDAH